jgi:hypothetical protein
VFLREISEESRKMQIRVGNTMRKCVDEGEKWTRQRDVLYNLQVL